MPKTLITRPNLHTTTSRIKSVKVKPKNPDNNDELKEFKEKLLSGSRFLKIY